MGTTQQAIKIYVDTNVLINYCTGQKSDVDCLKYIFSKRRKEVLFTSTLALVQTISKLQTKTKSRKAFTTKETKQKINELASKFTILDLSMNDVQEALISDNKDIEDSVHYFLSQKAKSNVILTNNISDFTFFNGIYTLLPRLAVAKRIIN